MKARFIVPAVYLAFATYAWIDFVRTNPDGLANVGLMLVTLPVTAFGLLLGVATGRSSFMLIPSGFGYVGDHALYYWPSVLVTASLLYCVCAAIGNAVPRR
jgi:hypothetical protein